MGRHAHGHEPVVLLDTIEDVPPFENAPEHGVAAVEVSLRGERDEPLRAARIGAGESHSDGAARVSGRVDLVPDRVTRSAASVPARVAGLDDKVRYDAVNHHLIEEALRGERAKA